MASKVLFYKLIREEVEDVFDRRDEVVKKYIGQDSRFIQPFLKQGFEFSPFSIGARPDGFFVSHVDFKDMKGDWDSKVTLKFVGNDFEQAFKQFYLGTRSSNSPHNLYKKLEAEAWKDNLVTNRLD
jgi:hypothetical protein